MTVDACAHGAGGRRKWPETIQLKEPALLLIDLTQHIRSHEAAAPRLPPAMSVITAVREYINKMLSEVAGMKALLLDAETVRPCVIAALYPMFPRPCSCSLRSLPAFLIPVHYLLKNYFISVSLAARARRSA